MRGSGEVRVEAGLEAKIKERSLKAHGVDEGGGVEVRCKGGVEERQLRGQGRVIEESIEAEGSAVGGGSGGDEVDGGCLRGAKGVASQEGVVVLTNKLLGVVDGRVEERVVEGGLVGVVETEVLADGIDGGRH